MEVIERLKDASFQAYIVGGAVRDHLLDQEVHDIDIATSATPQEVQQIFSSVIPVGIEHGTVIVRHLKHSFEVTTFRKEEGYSNFRHPDHVQFVDSIKTDLSRRDFTINAIAMTEDGLFIDPFNGQVDLSNRMIRAVGTPIKRFIEDPLRILRAVRFVSQLNFEIEDVTFSDLKANVSLVEKLSIERITAELTKLFQGKAIKKAIDYSHQSSLFNHLPIFKEDQKLIEILLDVDVKFDNIIDLFCYLYFKTNGSTPIKKWASAYRLSNKDFLEGQTLVDLVCLYEKEGLTPWLVYQLPENLINRFIQLTERLCEVPACRVTLDHLKTSLAIEKKQDINFNGHDLIAIYKNRRSGNWIAKYLAEVERKIVEHQLPNDYEQIKEWILSIHLPENN